MNEFEIDPRLRALAERWETYIGASERTGRSLHPLGGFVELEPVEVAVERCAKCHDEIFPATVWGRLAHLMAGHGYRMDGRQFNDRNEEIGRA